MLTSLNQLLSRMDALVPGGRCLRAEEGAHEKPRPEEDETRMELQMPKVPESDLYNAYRRNLNKTTWDYKIICDDGEVPINRAFACLLFESIKTKEVRWATTQKEFRMLGVNEDELRGLIRLAFQKVLVTKRDLVRCIEIAKNYLFWGPALRFLVQSIDNDLAIEESDIEKQIGEQERTIMSNITPKKDLPRRYAFSTQAVRWVEVGKFYGLLMDDGYIQTVISAETLYFYPNRTVHVLTWPTRHIQNVPISHLHALLNFDGVTAKVGYPVMERMYEGGSLKDISEETEPLLVGKFYAYYDSGTDRRNVKWMAKRLIVFLLGFSVKGEKAYILHPQHQGIASVDPNKLYTIERGEGATDEATCTRANVILDADPPPAYHNFGDTRCTNITQLNIGEYCHLNDPMVAENDPARACVDDSRRRIPVLYLGPAPDSRAYVFAHKREMIVNVEYLFLRRNRS
jgi:hypothetical protein